MFSLITTVIRRQTWKSFVGGSVIVAGLVIATNPELRALLLFVDAVGAEVFFLVVWAQLRFYGPWLRDAVEQIRTAACGASLLLLRGSLLLTQGLLSSRVFAMPLEVLAVMLSGLQCPTRERDRG